MEEILLELNLEKEVSLNQDRMLKGGGDIAHGDESTSN